MVATVLLLQLAVAQPGGIPEVRALFEAGDSVGAAEALVGIVTGQRLTAEALAAFALLEWMAPGATEHEMARRWQKLREPHVRLRREVQRGALLLGDPVSEAVGDALLVQDQLEDGRPDSLVSFALDPAAQPRPWREVLDAKAQAIEAESPLAAAGIRWLRVRGLLVQLNRVAAEAPVVPPCRPRCFRLDTPPAEYRLLARFQAVGQDTSLTQLAELFAELHRAPWPYNALGARAHVAVCALTRLNQGVAGCWPDGSSLGGREAAEVEAMVHVFRGQHGLGWRVMEAAPQWFAPLDSLRDFVDPPARRTRSPVPYRYVPSRPSPNGDRRLSIDLLWKAAWPLYLRPYNERLVVHRARLLLADVVWRLAVKDSRGLFYPDGDPERLVRVGVPLGVARTEPDARQRVTAWTLLEYYPRATHETAPETAPATGRGSLSMPLDLAIVSLGSRDERMTGFASEDYDVFGPLDHQVVQYVRDGRRQVDLHTAWAGPSCPQARPVLGLFLLDGGLRELRRTVLPTLEPGRHLQLRLTLHPALYVYSLELFDSGCRRAERARYVLMVPTVDGQMLSDVMLADELHYGDEYRGADRLRDRAPVTVRPSLYVEAGGSARFYWEIYGIVADTLVAGRLRVEFEVVNVREQRVALRDLGQVAREADRAKAALDISYALNVPPGSAPLTTGMAVGLPAGTRGVHLARLKVTDTVTGTTSTAQRAFFVRE